MTIEDFAYPWTSVPPDDPSGPLPNGAGGATMNSQPRRPRKEIGLYPNRDDYQDMVRERNPDFVLTDDGWYDYLAQRNWIGEHYPHGAVRDRLLEYILTDNMFVDDDNGNCSRLMRGSHGFVFSTPMEDILAAYGRPHTKAKWEDLTFDDVRCAVDHYLRCSAEYQNSKVETFFLRFTLRLLSKQTDSALKAAPKQFAIQLAWVYGLLSLDTVLSAGALLYGLAHQWNAVFLAGPALWLAWDAVTWLRNFVRTAKALRTSSDAKRRIIASKSALALIHDDLYGDVYDGEAMMRRLVAIEPEVKLPTYVYTLLKRRIAAGRL
jgi:hypothetical protein